MKQIFPIFFLLLVEEAVISADSIVYCDNNCKPAAATHGKYYCIEGKANSFTRCSNGVRHSFDCPPGLHWDQPLLRCDYPARNAFQCECAPMPTTLAPATKVTTTAKLTTAHRTTTAQPTTMGTTTPYNSTTMKRACYFTNLSQYRPKPANYNSRNVDPALCSHIFYAFLNASASGIATTEYNDEAMIADLVALRKKNPDLKLMASIGGSSAGTFGFAKIISSPNTMKTFNQGAIKFLRKYRFDGLDVDYEFPGAADKDRFTKWMQMLAKDFGAENTNRSRLFLSAVVSADKAKVDAGYDVPKISSAVDMINIMAYDFVAGGFSTVGKTTGHNSPLKPKSHWPANSGQTRNTVSNAVKYWIQKGAPVHKILLGIPFFGRSFRLTTPGRNQLDDPVSGPGLAGTYTAEKGFNSYFETCMMYKCPKPMYTYVYDRDLEAPYIYSSAKSNWVGTEDVDSVAAKVRFAMSQKLAGVFLWSLDLDDFADMCDNGVKYPLLQTVNNVIKGLEPPLLYRNTTSEIGVCGATVS